MIPVPSVFLPEGVAGRIRKVAAAAEKLGRLHPDVLALAYEQQWFRALVPKRYGGLALPLPVMVRLEEGLSWADGSLGWTVTLCSGAVRPEFHRVPGQLQVGVLEGGPVGADLAERNTGGGQSRHRSFRGKI